MSTATPAMVLDSVIALEDISWQTYEMLRDQDRNRHVRMTFDQGTLYLLSPSRQHERIAEILSQMVVAWTDVHSIPRLSAGSTTMRDKIRQYGLEPDKCYYIQNEAVVRQRDQYDVNVDPPPDLAIEVDVTSLSTVRMPIYASFKVPEIWRWFNDEIEVHRLDGSSYVQMDRSTSLTGFPFDVAIALLDQRHDMDETKLLANFRQAIH